MSERRPHWDDDLIDSVVHAISDNYDYEYRAYAVIAAVEDWHKKRWAAPMSKDNGMKYRKKPVEIEAVQWWKNGGDA